MGERTDDDVGVQNADVQDADESTASRLKTALDEWDEQQHSSFNPDPEPEFEPRDPDEIAEFERRIGELEGDLSSATERAEASEGVVDFIDQASERLDRHDFGRAVEHLVNEVGCDSHVAELELKQKLLEDAEFREAADDRFDNPDRLNSMLSEFADDLMERYPNNSDHGLTAAVMAARDVTVSRGDHGDEFSGVNWNRLSNQDFQVQSRAVFAAQKAGRIRTKGRRSGGWSTSPK